MMHIAARFLEIFGALSVIALWLGTGVSLFVSGMNDAGWPRFLLGAFMLLVFLSAAYTLISFA